MRKGISLLDLPQSSILLILIRRHTPDAGVSDITIIC